VSKNRLEAFSDGVIAILITIMVLELKVPHEPTIKALAPLAPVLLSYALSFVYLGIYWNNHHHLLQATRVIDGRVLWANLHLLFWLSLFPFATGWMGENDFAPIPTGLYGFVFLMAAIAYFLLLRAIISVRGQTEAIAASIGRDWKGKVSPVIYLASIPVALVAPYVALAAYVVVAGIWVVPDPRMERAIEH
jgi:uncharacterized membrane protein